jgi:tetratricopeptide (TPR) repeat protein
MERIQKFKDWFQEVPLRTKMYVVASASIVIVLVVVVVLISKLKPVNDESSLDVSQAAQTKVVVKQTQRDGAIRDAAQQALDQGNTAKASEVYKNAIEAETTTTRKIQLTIDESGVLYAAGKYDEAIKVAQDAEALSDDKFLIADWLSRLFEDQKNYQQAAHYYTLAGQWAKSPNNLAKLSKSYYDSEAARVTALTGQK